MRTIPKSTLHNIQRGQGHMGKIVAIGGGEIQTGETLGIDKEIVRLTGKLRPKALFIPTASGDAEEYWEAFDQVYGSQLGCETDILRLLNAAPSLHEIERKILSADLVYVGGGNTLKMMRRWRRLRVDRVLEVAYRTGIVLSGVSAGAICWFKYGHSDSISFYHPESWKYVRVKGLGFINAIGVPHYNTEGRAADFQRMMAKYSDIGIAIDNNCAIEFVDDKFRVITSQEEARCYRLYKSSGAVVTERIAQTTQFMPTASLWTSA